MATKTNSDLVKKLELAIRELKDYIELEKAKNRLTIADVSDVQKELIESAKQKISEVK